MQHTFLGLSKEEAKLYDSENPFGEEISNAFPDEREDFIEAARSLATGRYTSCVFHLTRAIESLTDKFGVKLGIADIFRKEWQQVLNEANAQIKRETSGQAGVTLTPQRKQELAKYSQVALILEHIKNAWRNPASHGEFFRDFEAKLIYHHVRTLTESLVKVL